MMTEPRFGMHLYWGYTKTIGLDLRKAIEDQICSLFVTTQETKQWTVQLQTGTEKKLRPNCNATHKGTSLIEEKKFIYLYTQA